jgi:hypothetical protein
LRKRAEKTDSFPLLKRFLQKNEVQLTIDLKSLFTDHLSVRKSHFEKYFPEDSEKHSQIKYLSEQNHHQVSFTTIEQEHLLDVSSDFTLRTWFPSMSVPGFWSSVEYPEISSKALCVLMTFAMSYICEAGYSAVAVIKSKHC